jgi:hypothetical protein
MDEIVKLASERFKDSVEAESENRAWMLDDLRFVYMAEQYQWPESVRQERERQKRPCLVINRMPQFIRQVVNDSRQNRPSIKVSGVDSQADPKTAEIFSGLVRHIERNSDADIAYDTAVESAIACGVGYFTIGTEYASEGGFEQELTIDRVVYPFSIYADCDSEAGDSSDWKYAFQIVTGDRAKLEKQYKTKEMKSWQDGGTGDTTDDDGDQIRLARYWKVTEDEKTLLLLTNGGTLTEDELTQDVYAAMQAAGVGVVEGRSRKIVIPKVSLHVLSGDAELETSEWAGRYIPIVPVYGSEFWLDGKRYFKSLIRDAKDPQRMLNYWRTASTELVALAPKAPWVGPKGFMKSSANKWKNANTENYSALEYDEVPSGNIPQRQPFAGMPAGALQEAMNAQDDIKSVTGLYDASLGARSNETSGRAIMARQREGDISTFHFQDNLVRAIRHAGRILIDLIPRVYDTPRVVRIVGVDGSSEQVQVNQPTVAEDDDGNPIQAIYDLSVGRYDLTVSAGPSYTTQRQESAVQMTEAIRAVPVAAPVILPHMFKAFDWPGAEEVAKDLEKLAPGNQNNPEQLAQAMQQAQQMGQQAQEAMAQVQAGQQQIEQGKAELKTMSEQIKTQAANLKTQEANFKAMQAEFQAEVATVKADLQGRELSLNVKAMQADQREATVADHERLSPLTERIAGLEGMVAGFERAVAPAPPPVHRPTRRQVRVKRDKGGELVGMIEDVADEIE